MLYMPEDVQILTEEEIKDRLAEFPGWSYEDNKITKEFQFKNFMDSFSFVGELVPFVQELDHHPDIHIMYSKVLFELQRFDVGGKVTNRDFLVAEEIEQLYKGRQVA